jgi:hypothetical protein
MNIDLADVPRQVTVPVGGTAEIDLPSYAGSGNYWDATWVEGENVAQVSIEVEERRAPASEADRDTEPPTATLARETAVVSGVSPGRSRWRLVLSRRFGEESPAAQHDVDVVVVDR